MRPDRIRFTGLDLTPEQAIRPRKLMTGVYPEDWTRHQWTLPDQGLASLSRLDRYIAHVTAGRWGSYMIPSMEGGVFVVLFERASDGVLFRLRGGEREFLKPEDDWGPGSHEA